MWVDRGVFLGLGVGDHHPAHQVCVCVSFYFSIAVMRSMDSEFLMMRVA